MEITKNVTVIGLCDGAYKIKVIAFKIGKIKTIFIIIKSELSTLLLK